MSKKQFEDVGARRGPESGFIPPERVTIIEIEDRKHPKHTYYRERLSPTNPYIVALAESMRVIGWETGSIAYLCRDGDGMSVAAARCRITAARIENARRKTEKDKRGPIEVPYLITKDFATAEAIENADKQPVPPMQTARDFVALKDALGDDGQAAARLNLTLAYAHQLEALLGAPLELQGKVNRREIAVDVAARMAKGGQAAAREAVASATDPTTGRVDPVKAKAAARVANPVVHRARMHPKTLDKVCAALKTIHRSVTTDAVLLGMSIANGTAAEKDIPEPVRLAMIDAGWKAVKP